MEKGKISVIKNTLIFDTIPSSGKFGCIRLGINFDVNKLVVVKEISLEALKEESKYKKLKEEGKIVKKIPNHQNIVEYHNFTESSDLKTTNIEEEYMDSDNLHDFLRNYKEKRKEPLNEAIIQHFVKSICNGISHLHKNKIIHRDLKLQNIMMHFNLHDISKEFLKIDSMGKFSLIETMNNRKSRLNLI